MAQDDRALVTLDPSSQAADLKLQEKYRERQDELYSAYKNRGGNGQFDPSMPDGDLSELYQQFYGQGYGEGYDDDMSQYEGSGRRGRNFLRRGGDGAAGAAGAGRGRGTR